MTERGAWRPRAEEIRQGEVSRALSGSGLSPECREVVASMSRSLVKRILEGPVSEALGASRRAAGPKHGRSRK